MARSRSVPWLSIYTLSGRVDARSSCLPFAACGLAFASTHQQAACAKWSISQLMPRFLRRDFLLDAVEKPGQLYSVELPVERARGFVR